MSNKTEQEKMNEDLARYGSSVGKVNYANGEIKHVPLQDTWKSDVSAISPKNIAKAQLYVAVMMFLLIIGLCWVRGSMAIVFCAVFGLAATIGAGNYLRRDDDKP